VDVAEVTDALDALEHDGLLSVDVFRGTSSIASTAIDAATLPLGREAFAAGRKGDLDDLEDQWITCRMCEQTRTCQSCE
jgi:hypothetical protein